MKIPAALTLNTYYTCYAIDKFILYLYRDRIYDVLCVILYLYGLLHTLYLQNFHFIARPQRTWISTRSAGEQNDKREKERKRRDILESDGSVNNIQHTNWRRYISLSLYLKVSISPRVFRVQIFNTDTQSKNFYWEKLLSGRGLRAIPKEETLGILIRKGTLWKSDPRRHEDQVRQNLSRVHYELERTMNPAGWQTTKCLCFFEVARQVEGWLMTTSETRMGSTCPANEKGIKWKVVVYMLDWERERK